MVMVKERVSKSLIIDFGEYVNGDMCGLVFNEKHITKTYPEDGTKKTRLGEYVEYLVLGSIPIRMKDTGKVPQPEYTSKGELTADYARAKIRALALKKLLFKDMGLQLISFGRRIENDWGSGYLDAELCDGPIPFFGKNSKGEPEIVIMDLKYTGLIDDQWSRYGFAFAGKFGDQQKEHHGKQGKQYTCIEGKRFFLGLLSSSYTSEKKEEDQFHFEFVELVATPEELMAHRDEAIYVRERVNMEASIGFKAWPEYNRCNECLIKEKCKSRALAPSKRVVNLTSDE